MIRPRGCDLKLDHGTVQTETEAVETISGVLTSMETIGSGFKAMEAVAETKLYMEAAAEAKANQRQLCTLPKPFPEF